MFKSKGGNQNMLKEIALTTREQIDIYMNPQRQRILKVMDLYAVPVTSKQISLKLGISSAAVTHHLKKLEELGVVALDHTAMVHGIQAKYYVHVPVNVNFGSDKHDDIEVEKGVLSDYLINETWKGFKQHLSLVKDKNNSCQMGDASCGIVYLTKEDAMELKSIIQEFYKKHAAPGPDTTPWETAVVFFPHNINDEIDL